MTSKSESLLAPQAVEDPPYPKPARAWYVLGLLTLVYVFSFLDRTILSLLVGPIRRDLSISDTQVSLLMGFSFALFYTFFGLPGRALTYDPEPVKPTDAWLKNKAIAEMRKEIQKGADWLNRFDWALRYSTSPEQPFVLTETPCVVEGKFSTLEEAMQRPDTLIVFPLCWQACLFGSLARFDIRTDEFSSEDLQTMHRKHFDKAREFIISPVKLEGL